MDFEFLITALAVVLIPGTGVLYTVAIGLSRGTLPSVAAALGCTLGIVPALIASVVGVSALLHASAVMFQALKIAGIAYLLYLAWKTLQDQGPLSLDSKTKNRGSLGSVAWTGCLINVLNPKLTVFFMAFLPQFVVGVGTEVTRQLLVMGGVFMLMTFLVFVGYGFCAALISRQVLKSEKTMTWIRRTIAAGFAGFGLRLAFAER
ncbi:MAG: LysE family translocator [Stappiaceae bacterium]